MKQAPFQVAVLCRVFRGLRINHNLNRLIGRKKMRRNVKLPGHYASGSFIVRTNPFLRIRISGSYLCVMVEHSGFEPLTPTLPVLCATSCANAPRTKYSIAWISRFVKRQNEIFLIFCVVPVCPEEAQRGTRQAFPLRVRRLASLGNADVTATHLLIDKPWAR